MGYIFVNGQVEEIKLVLKIDGELLEQHLLGVLVGDIFHHHGCPPVPHYILELNDEPLALLNGY
jgi:hypothetical protein